MEVTGARGGRHEGLLLTGDRVSPWNDKGALGLDRGDGRAALNVPNTTKQHT